MSTLIGSGSTGASLAGSEPADVFGPLGAGYRLDPAGFDEAVDDHGTLRPGWAQLLATLGLPTSAAFAERQRQADRLLDAEGAGHLVHELSLDHTVSERSVTPWRLDPLPFAIGRDEFELLAAAATQRMSVLETFLDDVYGEQRLVGDRVVPAERLYSWRSFRPWPVGAPKRWLVTYAVDVARDASGRWGVVRDLTDAPGGLGAALLARSVVARLSPEALRTAGVHPIHRHFDLLRQALLATSPSDRYSPRCVVLTPGPASDAYVEHSYLAARLGYHLVEGADLVMRDGRLWLRALDGLEPVDVLFRRVPDEHFDPLEAKTRSGIGVPGVIWGTARGGIGIANAPGTSVAAEPGVADLLDAISRRTTGQALQLQRLPADAALATTPSIGRDGVVRATSGVVLRLHLVAGPSGVSVMPGATARSEVLGDEPLTVFKDVWVTGDRDAARALVLRPAPAPQVDLFSSLPRRAADSLYWLGRAAERAEVAARTAVEVGNQMDRDPDLLVSASGDWGAVALGLLRTAQGLPPVVGRSDAPMRAQIAEAVATACEDVARRIAIVVREATAVREFLSTTTGRVLGRLAAARERLADPIDRVDSLDGLLVELAALSGLATESTVRGPAWRFYDIGRRLERALAVLGSLEAALGPDVDPDAMQPAAESVLAANESLVAYRRRYRSDVALDAVADLLAADDTNPRGVTFQIDRLREHMASLGWSDGMALVDRAGLGAITTVDASVANGRRLSIDALVLAVRGPLLELGAAVGKRWFADPVNPTVIGGR